MTVHLLKMAAGIESLAHLRRRQQHGLASRGDGTDILIHRTRHFPRRFEDVLDGGSLYWIVKRHILARNRIIGLDRTEGADGRPLCAIHLESRLVPVMPTRRRPIQGWRYMEPADAPADLTDVATGEEAEPLPPEMASELKELGLI